MHTYKSFYKITAHSVTMAEMIFRKLSIDWSISTNLYSPNISLLFIIFFSGFLICPNATLLIHSLTCFNHLMHTSPDGLPPYARLRSYWSLHPIAFDFPYPHYIFTCPLWLNSLMPIFHRVWTQSLTASTVISVLNN